MTPRVLTRHEVADVPHLVPGGAAASVRVRPLERGDAPAVLAVFAGMGARSRQLRFLAPKHRLTDREVRVLTGVDGRDHEAVLATSATDGAAVGIARFVRTEDEDAAEVAVAVVDAWQRRGVGGLLLAALARRAGELGVRRFSADVASDNVAVLKLLRRSSDRWSLVHSGHGVSQVVVALDGMAARPVSRASSGAPMARAS